MIHAIHHATIDTLKMLPLLFLSYVFIEIIEKFATPKLSTRAFSGKLAPVVGAGVGLIPQCGLSVVATNLFSKKHIALGTLMAVYISTSDEALPILLSNPHSFSKILPLLGIKFVLAVAVGYVVNLLVRKKQLQETDGTIGGVGCHHHEISGDAPEHTLKSYIFHPLMHTATVFAFLWAVNIIFAMLVHFVGDERIAQVLSEVGIFAPAIAGIVGLIPNCAASIIITQMYSLGQIGLGSAVAGLSVSAGLGIAVLFKQNKNFKQNLAIVAFLYAISVAVGTLLELIL